MLANLCAMLWLTSCVHPKEEKEEIGKFLITSPLQVDTSFTKEFVAQIRSIKNIEIRAQEKGYLQNIYVDEGQSVKEGQLLFRIMPKVYEATLLKAQAEADEAAIELQNATALVEKNVISKNEQAMAQAKLDAAKAEVSLAKLHLSFTEIKAPFDIDIEKGLQLTILNGETLSFNLYLRKYVKPSL